MSTENSVRDIRARIQAFEGRAGAAEGNGSQSATPSLPPRRPPVAAKPAPSRKPYEADQNPLNPFTSFRAEVLSRPAAQSIRGELEALHSGGAQLDRPRLPGSVRSDGFDEEEASVNPFKEALKPNINANNHNLASMFPGSEFTENPLRNLPPRPQVSNKPMPARRPTTIRVPSAAASVSDHFHAANSALASAGTRPSLKPSLPVQSPFSAGREPMLPPRPASMKKGLPPRPAPAKPSPGRPPATRLQATGRSLSEPTPAKKGLRVPPRPSPGHLLYNKYTLELPHGIASVDFDGTSSGQLTIQKNEVLLLLEEINQSEFECSIGDVRGRVHKSHMKVITPLWPNASATQDGAASFGDRAGINIKALYDFTPERPEELRLRAGDVLTEVEQVDSSWYRGSHNGHSGFFPANFVQVLPNSPKLHGAKNAKERRAPVSGPRCQARFDFEGEQSDELSFSEGDVIQLKEYVGEDWARGQLGGAVGIFPLNFVEILQDLPPATSRQQLDRDAIPGGQQSRTQENGAERMRVQALYSYSSECEEELSIQVGDIITNVKSADDDWFMGDLRGKRALVPKTYVQVLE